MSNDNFDDETKQYISEGEALAHMFGTPGWSVAERELTNLIAELRDVTGLDLDKDDIKQQIRDKINTAAAMEHWLDELKGQVMNTENFEKGSDDTLITRR